MALTLDGTNGIVSSGAISSSSNITATGSITTQSATGVIFSDSSALTAASSPFVLKNRIINGDMVIAQRGTGPFTSSGTTTYGADRWKSYDSTNAGKFTSQQSSTAPTGFTKSLLITSTSAYTSAATDVLTVYQPIEGFNTADLGWGAAGASTVTLSFWVRSSLTGSFGGSLQNAAQSRNYPISYTINAANTWEQKTITIPGDTTGTWATDNSIGIAVVFNIGTGSTYAAAANSWTATNYITTATGTQNLTATNGATLYITGVQLEIGSTATPFERRLYGQELINCQRYYQAQIIDIGNSAILSGNVTNGVEYYGSKTLQVAMRAAPTVTWGTQWGVNGFAATAPTASWLAADGFRFYKAANSTTNGGYIFQAWAASAEL